jgi:hypothetical protein
MVSNTGSVLWENATLTLSPTSGSYGTSVKVSGGHYQAGEQVNVYLNNASTTPVLMTTASSTGTISGSFKVGAMPNGFYPVLAVGQTSGNQGNATFQMGAMSVFSATSGGQGTALTYIVRGFLPNENVNLYFGTTGCPTCNQLPSFKTNGVGSGAQIFHVPELGGGSYQIRVVGQTSGIVISKPYKIVNSITLLPTSGLPGATTTIFGAGFGPNESVTVTFNCGSASCTGGTAMGTVQTDNRGDFTLVDTATPTGAAAGSYPIGALGQTSKLFAKATFTVS